ncbi:MAG: VCBS repeat-containing protein, partial [Acidobacteriota bacterium]|nr:VCBS repeat-containing protein [Acidobacteriota bacterium]
VNAWRHSNTYDNRSGRWLSGDLNGDGRMDLIHLLRGTYMNSWLSNGDGSFNVREFHPPGGRYAVYSGQFLAADFNGDRKTDLVHFVNNDYVHIWLSNGDGSFKVLDKYAPWPGYHFGSPKSWHTGDFNGDGFTDLIHIVGGDYVHTWISKGDGTFSVGFFRPAPGYHSGWGRWLTGDLDADGKTDLVHLVPSDYVHPWLSKGDGTFAVSRFSPTPGYNVNSGWWVTGDLNGDGKTDLVHLTQSSYVHPWISGADQSTYTYILATPQAAQCPGCPINPSVIVWINTPSGLYRCKGMKLYGRTKQGEYMTQKQAQDRGYRKAYGGICR